MTPKLFFVIFLLGTPAWAKTPANPKLNPKAPAENPNQLSVKRETHEYRKKELKAQWEFEDKQEAELRAFKDQTTKEARESLLAHEEEIFAAPNAYSDALIKQRREKMTREGQEQIQKVNQFQIKLKKDLQDFLANQRKEREVFTDALRNRARSEVPPGAH